MPYFHISTGLRGCYMPNDAWVSYAPSRKALKGVLEDACGSYKDAEYVGGSKAHIAHVCALAWRNRKVYQLPYCIPFARKRGKSYSEGVFVSSATRKEYLEYLKSQGE
jgi:hypothetical protein